MPFQAADYSGEITAPPVTQWQRQLPGARYNASANADFSRPAVSAQHIYIGAANQQSLFQLDRGAGTVVGRYDAGAPVKAEPVILEDGILFSDGAGYTWRYEFGAKEPVWRHFAGAPVLARPLVAEGVVYVAALDNVVHALDLAKGESMWLYTHPPDQSRESELELYGAPSPVLADDMLLCGFHDGRLVALDRQSGEPSWERPVGEGRYPDLVAEPLVSGRDLFVGGFSAPFIALDMETRNVRWRLEHGTAARAAIRDRTLYVPGADGRLRAVDSLTGTLIWEWDSETTGALTQAQITSAGLLLGSSDGSLWLVDEETGEARWTFDEGWMPNGITVTPVIADRQVLVVTNAGNLLSLLSPVKAAPTDEAGWPL